MMAGYTSMRPHGFFWPAGMPACAMCQRNPNDPIHVTPARGGGWRSSMVLAADESGMPSRPHAYLPPAQAALGVLCTACGRPLSDGCHPVGAPSRMGNADTQGVGPAVFASENERVSTRVETPTFSVERDGKLILVANADVIPLDSVRPEVQAQAEKAAKASAHVWVGGRYVEADNPNRNAAYWSTADLELGQPSVAHGPVNWLHESRHIIGSIAAAELVRPEPGVAVAAGEEQVGNHIAAIGALWPWLWPDEIDVIRQASNDGKLAWSMECVAKEVACLIEGCGHQMDYRTYVTQAAARCDHMQLGAPRRFVDPLFLGGAMIVPPVRPGWANANAAVLEVASGLVERQAAAFVGFSATEAEQVVALAISAASE